MLQSRIAPFGRRASLLTAPTLILFLGLGTAALRPSFAFPRFWLVRGADLAEPIVMSWPLPGALPGRSPAVGIVTIYGSLMRDRPLPAGYASRPHYEIAEFWGCCWAQHDLVFTHGSTFAKLYRGTRAEPPVWVGRWEGRDGVPRVLGDSGAAILQAAGLKLR